MQLLFIISQPRSGSTLLQSIVSNNRHIETTSEPWVLLPLLGVYDSVLNSSRYNSEWMLQAFNNFINKNVGEQEYRIRLKEFIKSLYSTLGNSETKYVLDKTPRYYEISDRILDYFPEAKFIVLKRHPFAVLSSMIDSWSMNSLKKLSNYRIDLLSAPFLIHKFCESSSGNGNILQLKYESVVKDPTNIVRDVYRWLGIEFSEHVLRYSENAKFKGDLGDQVGINRYDRPVDSGVDSWKRLMTEPFWRDFLMGYSAYLGKDFLKSYGDYESVSDEKTKVFRYFQFVSAQQEPRDSDYMTYLKNGFRLMQYQLAFGKDTKERPLTGRQQIKQISSETSVT